MTVPKTKYEELLRLEEARRAEIQDLYDRAPCGYHSVDADGRIVRINETELQWLGYTRDEVEGVLTVHDVLTPDSVPLVHEGLVSLMKNPTGRLEREVRMRRKDGSEFDALVAVTAVVDDDGGFVMTRVSTFDITSRKQAEEALRRSEAALANAQRIAHMGDWAWDIPTGELRWSDEIFRIFLTDQASFGGTYQAFLSFVHPKDRLAVEQAVHAAVHLGQPYNLEHRIVRADGSIRIVHEQAEVELAPNGEPSKMCGVVQDVTELRTAIAASEHRALELERVREMERLQSSFIDSISHDLRQPITTVLGYGEILEDEIHGPLTEAQRLDLGQIVRAAGRLKTMVDDLLDSARIKAGMLPMHFKPADIGPLAGAVSASFGPMAEQKGIALEISIDERLPRPVIDSAKIERVLSNLLHNALKFTPPGGQVHLVVSPDVGGLRIEVRDTGPGIAPDDVPKLFHQFSQLTEGRLADGVGLGLSVCKSIVEAHNGRIGVDSVVGVGSRFWISLPLAQPGERPSQFS